MRPSKSSIMTVVILLVLSFSYGVATVEYKVFPFDILLVIKQTFIEKTLSNDHSYYSHKKSLFEGYQHERYDVVFIGDSITDMAEWENLFPASKIANRGISGDTTGGVLQRMSSILSTKAEYAFIMIGINDFNRGVNSNLVYINYEKIVKTLVANNMNVYVQSTILVGDEFRHLNSNIKFLNDKLQVLAKNTPLVTYIDLNKRLSPNGDVDKSNSTDGIHLNAKAYSIWRDAIQLYIP
ncbi:MAG: lysophospholipase L1-like esterase [Candidatus Endobugula sp.]|jgi:lysophospholipase L1-like esterase